MASGPAHAQGYLLSFAGSEQPGAGKAGSGMHPGISRRRRRVFRHCRIFLAVGPDLTLVRLLLTAHQRRSQQPLEFCWNQDCRWAAQTLDAWQSVRSMVAWQRSKAVRSAWLAQATHRGAAPASAAPHGGPGTRASVNFLSARSSAILPRSSPPAILLTCLARHPAGNRQPISTSWMFQRAEIVTTMRASPQDKLAKKRRQAALIASGAASPILAG